MNRKLQHTIQALAASAAVSLGRFRRLDTRSPVQRMDTSQGRWGLKPRKH